MNIDAIAVFCGSKNGVNPIYSQHAAELGKLIALLNLKLVYGGGKKGLMGIIADAVLEHGGRATGVIPKVLIEWEQQHDGLSELTIVPDMHTRKKLMYEMGDAAIVLPGGFGTLDELFEMLTWNQLQIHDKKIFLMNSGNFYQHLMEHIRNMENTEFLYEKATDNICLCKVLKRYFNI